MRNLLFMTIIIVLELLNFKHVNLKKNNWNYFYNNSMFYGITPFLNDAWNCRQNLTKIPLFIALVIVFKSIFILQFYSFLLLTLLCLKKKDERLFKTLKNSKSTIIRCLILLPLSFIIIIKKNLKGVLKGLSLKKITINILFVAIVGVPPIVLNNVIISFEYTSFLIKKKDKALVTKIFNTYFGEKIKIAAILLN